MDKITIEKSTETIRLYTYKYIWKQKDNKLCVKVLTGVQEEHAKFQTAIQNDNNIVSCMREYLGEMNLSYMNFTEPVKLEDKPKEEKQDEKV